MSRPSALPRTPLGMSKAGSRSNEIVGPEEDLYPTLRWGNGNGEEDKDINKLGDRISRLERGKGDASATPTSGTGTSEGNISAVVEHANIRNPRPDRARTRTRADDSPRRREESPGYRLGREEYYEVRSGE
ncbi:hypothetical protein BGX38DRAFT_1267366 [Terfezia claveryi]|nr:hypothetical protein BGX38DRAFT_1267366 [Terfezia claveryi]